MLLGPNTLKRYYKDDISNVINYRQYILRYFIDFIYIDLIKQFTHNVATATQLSAFVNYRNYQLWGTNLYRNQHFLLKDFYHNKTHC